MASESHQSEPRKRVRLSPDKRREQIIAAASEIIAAHGYFGMSLQDVADRVGISQAGMLHYVGNKEGLLNLVISQRYDRRNTPVDYGNSGEPGAVHPDGMSLPGYFRFLVDRDGRDLQLLKLYNVLSAEAASEGHPAHDYFAARPIGVWWLYSFYHWRIPPQIGGWSALRDTVELALMAMDGLQRRVFWAPAIDMNAEWLKFEAMLFPSPLWDGYR